MKQKAMGIGLCVAMLSLTAPGAASANTAGGANPVTSEHNTVLLSASSPFEDLSEFALAGDRQAVTRALTEYGHQADRVAHELPAAARGDIDATVKRIQNATAAGDYQAAAEGGVHAYRVLIEALDPNRLSVPAQVDWLDYAGFRFQVLLHATGVEWKEVGKAAAVAQHKWNELKPRVRDGRFATQSMRRSVEW